MSIRKNSGSVFRQLVGSYVLFAVFLVIGVNVCMFGILIGIGGGSIETLAPYDMVDGSGKIQNLSVLEKNGGWIEKLDEDYHVLEVYGDKLDEPESYTQEEIYEYLVTDNFVETAASAKDYRGFIKTVQKGGQSFYYFIKIDRKALSLTYNYNAGSSQQGRRLTIGFLLLFVLFFAGNCFLMSRYLSRKISEEKKNRMLLELSHDIKTPVATIKSYANALEEGLVKTEDLKECYRIIDKKAVRVDVLVNEMFLLLKLDNPEYELELEQTDLCELVRSVCAEYYEELEDKGIEMHIEIPETPITADVDKKEFTRVIENLLCNIRKYNQTGQGAWITVRELRGRAEMIIQDDGEAVAEEIRPILFDPFVRGDKARTSKGGTGLGLAIARKIVGKLGGTIEYTYEEGKNQFKITL